MFLRLILMEFLFDNTDCYLDILLSTPVDDMYQLIYCPHFFTGVSSIMYNTSMILYKNFNVPYVDIISSASDGVHSTIAPG
jgi:hypothetical protein